MKKYLFLIWLLSAGFCRAEDTVTFLISSSPEGAVVRRNNEEWGLTGQEFSVSKKKLPSGNASLYLQLVRKNYKPSNLVLPYMVLQQARSGDGTVIYPKDGAVTLEPLHPLVPLKENPLPLIALLAGVGGVGVFLRRTFRSKREAEERSLSKERLIDGVREHHEMVGKNVGPYLLLEQLGEGGLAKVYRAVPSETLDEKEAVALKVLHSHLIDKEQHSARFLREGKVSQDLVHPNIVRLYAIDRDESLVYLVLELLDGKTLREDLDGAMLAYPKIADYMSQILDGLCYAHERGIIHRDLTPANIMITNRGVAKVMDFGLARRREVDKTLTGTGVVQGTPGYMAPEQLKQVLDARCDQYSLGVILFQMLTGRKPIERDEPLQTIVATYTEDAPDPRDFRPDIPVPLAEYTLKLLRRDPDQRFQDMAAARAAFPGS